MADNWDDWETDDFVVPSLNELQMKQLEERKLVEEADNELVEELFSKEPQKPVSMPEVIITKKEIPKPQNKRNVHSNKTQNEAKQKEMSKKNKEQKQQSLREKELFGEVEYDDEYAEYDDMYY